MTHSTNPPGESEDALGDRPEEQKQERNKKNNVKEHASKEDEKILHDFIPTFTPSKPSRRFVTPPNEDSSQ